MGGSKNRIAQNIGIEDYLPRNVVKGNKKVVPSSNVRTRYMIRDHRRKEQGVHDDDGWHDE